MKGTIAVLIVAVVVCSVMGRPESDVKSMSPAATGDLGNNPNMDNNGQWRPQVQPVKPVASILPVSDANNGSPATKDLPKP